MSTFSSKLSKSAVKKSTPYCATCHKANQPVSVYTGHWTKSSPGPEGVVVCPLILNTVCKYCRQSGHWTKYCPKLSSTKGSDDRSDDHSDDRSVGSDDRSVGSASDILKKVLKITPVSIKTTSTSEVVTIEPATATSKNEFVVGDKYNYTKRNLVVSKSAPLHIPESTRDFPSLPATAVVMTTPIPIPTLDKTGNFTPVTPDSTPPNYSKISRRLWADMDDDE